MSQFLEINDVVTHVSVTGPPGAPAVLLIHSLGSSLEIWESQARALAAGSYVIRYDLSVKGLSAASPCPVTLEDFAADALAILDAFGLAEAHIGGISIGGMIAQQVARLAPARVRSLMLCATSMQQPPPQLWLDRAAQVRAGGLRTVVDGTLDRWITPAFADTPAGRGLRTLFLRTSVEGYVGAVEVLAAADLREQTPGLPHPALVLVGEQDPSTPLASSLALAAALPASRLVVIPGARHIPLGEYAEQVNAALLEHLTPHGEDHGEDQGGEAAGRRVRAEVMGAEHVAAATASASSLDRDFQAYLTRAAWGEVWARPHLDRRTRSVVTIALLAALGHEHELTLHLRAMKRTGATQSDLTELLLHVAVYAGVPAANAAMRLAKAVLEEKR